MSEANVGSILGYLRLDRSDWDRELAAAGRKADDLARHSPNIKIGTNSTAAIAQLAAVAAAVRRLQDAQGAESVAEAKLQALRNKGVADIGRLRAAEEAVTKARRAQAAAVINLANVQAQADKKVAGEADKASKSMSALATAALALGPAMIPVAAVGAGALVGLAGSASTALLAVLGIKDEMARGTAIGKQYSAGVNTMTGEFSHLKQVAAAGTLSGFNTGVKSLQGLFPMLNRDVAMFSSQLGKIAGNVAPGMVSMLHQFNPLMETLGNDLVGGSAKFKQWASSSNAVGQFVAYVQTQLPNVEHTLSNLFSTAGHVVSAFAPFGSTMLLTLRLFSQAINAIPVPVLQTVVPLLAGLALGMKAMAVAKAASISLAGTAAGITATGAVASGASRTVGTLGRAVGFLGPVGLAAGVALGGLSLIMGHSQKKAQEQTSAVNRLTEAIQAGAAAAGIYAELQKGGAANNALGVDPKTLIGAVEQQGGAVAALSARLKDLHSSQAAANQAAINAASVFGETSPQYQSAEKYARNFGHEIGNLTGTLATVQGEYAKAKAKAVDYAQQQGDATLAAQVESGQIDRVAHSLGMTADEYYAAKLAADKNTKSTQDQTHAMQLAGDAAGLLKQAFDALNGKTLSAAQAENAFEQQLVSLVKHTTAADASLQGMSSSAIQNRGDLVSLVGSAETAAAAYGDLKKSSEAGRQKLIQMRQTIIDNAVAHGEDRAQVTAFIDSVMKIPKSVPPLPIKVQTTAAEAALQRVASYLALLSAGVTVPIRTSGSFSYTPGAGTGSEHLPPKKPHKAAGGPITGPGTGTSDDVPIMASNGEFVSTAKSAARNRAALDAGNRGAQLMVAHYANGGIVTLTPKHTTAKHAAKHTTGSHSTAAGHTAGHPGGPTAAQIAAHGRLLSTIQNVDIAKFLRSLAGTSSAIQGAESTLVNAVTRAGGGATLGHLLAGENWTLLHLADSRTGIANRLKNANAKLAAATQSYNDERSKVQGTISGSFDVTNAGFSAQQILANLGNANTKASKFGAELGTLRKLGLSKGLLAQLAEAGVSAEPQALALSRASKSQIGQLNAGVAQLANTGKNIGTIPADMLYGAGVNAAKGLVAGLKSQEAALSRQMTHLADIMVGQIRRDLRIHSPSLVARELGGHFGGGFALGIRDMHPAVRAASSGMAGAALPDSGAGRSGAGQTINLTQHIHPQPYQSEYEIGRISASEVVWGLRR